MFHLIQIPEDHIRAFWPMCGALLGRALVGGGTSLQRELERSLCGDTQVWAVVEEDGEKKNIKAVGITSIQLDDHDGTKRALIENFSGEDMTHWFEKKADFEAWAIAQGCNEIRIRARKGWAPRLPDYKITHYEMRKALQKETV